MATTEMWVVVQLNGEPLAFPATLIKEVVPWQPLNPVPSQATGVMGMVSLRGETLAVMDVLQMNGIGSVDDPSFMLVLDFPESRVGLAVDKVEGVQYFSVDEMDSNMAGGYIQGTLTREDRLYQMVNPHALEQLMAQFTDVGTLEDTN
ncbi:chemotaxis protein CheW [Reinekea thalattae]|uniref:Chemotaxis protein CheW n=1 Tax=Reinekea thalattae TaxID=2593301 RepID=A0A5C8YZM8_9GAMM|nr:chemotaxis protein CheW [Reinekea thalattae]TXR51332.1 chemotaxis protein CheW [Reinekea thalattae]